MELARFGELAVFPEDAEIPVGVVARLWKITGGLADFETEDGLIRLFDLSLLLDLDLGQRFFRLHDTTRHFLRDQAGKEGLVAQHKQLVAALDGAENAETDARTRRYYYLYLPHHLAEANERARLDAAGSRRSSKQSRTRRRWSPTIGSTASARRKASLAGLCD